MTEAVAADCYMLLIYDTGSFFVGHRDTEKIPDMFADPSQKQWRLKAIQHRRSHVEERRQDLEQVAALV